jgi:small GTP-binding protein
MHPRPPTAGFKVAFIGPCGAGKTSIITRFRENVFSPHTEPTIGASFFCHGVNTEHGTIPLNIWDTAGQERYKNLVPMYCRNAAALVVVYDISSASSFEESKFWCDSYRSPPEAAHQEIYFVANKIDLGAPAVDELTAREYAESVPGHYFLTSATTGQGIEALFQDVAARVAVLGSNITRTPNQEIDESSGTGGCCS